MEHFPAATLCVQQNIKFFSKRLALNKSSSCEFKNRLLTILKLINEFDVWMTKI